MSIQNYCLFQPEVFRCILEEKSLNFGVRIFIENNISYILICVFVSYICIKNDFYLHMRCLLNNEDFPFCAKE